MSAVVDQGYWDALYQARPLGYNRERVLFKDVFDAFLKPGGTCFEVGCYPGRFLMYLGTKFGYEVSGIDLTPPVLTLLPEHLRAHGVKVGRLIHGDFFDYEPDRRYDVVCSFGFLEHFKDTREVIRRHVQLVRPGGTLILSSPNFRKLQHVLHRLLDAEGLARHETAAMNLKLWQRILWTEGMDVIYQGYYGTADFWNSTAQPGRLNRVATRLVKRCFKRVSRQVNWPNCWLSPYMVSVSRYPDRSVAVAPDNAGPRAVRLRRSRIRIRKSASLLRVLHIHHAAMYGGSERSTLQLIRAIHPRGIESAVLTGSTGDFWMALRESHIDSYRSPLRRPPSKHLKASFHYWRRLRCAVRALRPDLLHICGFHLMPHVCLLPLLTGLPTIVHVRGRVSQQSLDRCTAHLLKLVTLFVCVSRFVQRTLHEYCPGLPTRMIYGGRILSECLPTVSPLAVRRSLGCRPGDCLVGMVANFDQRVKKHETFLKAACRLTCRPDIRFVIVGGPGSDPAYFNETQRLARTLGIDGQVQFIGFRKDVSNFINAFDVLALCSSVEGLPGVLVEAMACEKPVIATNVGGVPEVAVDGRTGFLFDVDDDAALARRITQLASAPDLRRKMGHAGRRRAEKLFSMERHASAMASLYSETYDRRHACSMEVAWSLVHGLVAPGALSSGTG